MVDLEELSCLCEDAKQSFFKGAKEGAKMGAIGGAVAGTGIGFVLALIDFLSVVKSGVQIRFKLKHVTNLAARAKRDGDRKKSEELIMLVKILKNYVKNNPFNAKFWSDQVWYSAKIIFKTAAVSALFSAASGAAISGYNRAVSDVNRSRSFR